MDMILNLSRYQTVQNAYYELTHWGRETHICISNLIIIGSDNGLSPGRRQAIIWNNVGILLIGLLGTSFREILTEIHIVSLKKMHMKMSSAKFRPFCLGLNVLSSCALHVKNTFDDKSSLVVVIACAVRQLAMIWANVDPGLCRHMVLLGHTDLRLCSVNTRNGQM